jgi:hypothetical protein
MKSVVVESNAIAPMPEECLRLWLDAPQVGAADGYSLEVAGWLVMKRGAVQRIEVLHGSTVVRTARVGIPRPDVAEYLGKSGGLTAEQFAAAESSGFMATVSVVGLPLQFELRVEAVLAGGARILLTVIRGRRAALRAGYRPRLQPISCNCVGRSGSTLLMHLLAGHPEIAVFNQYPFECHYALHMLRALQVIGAPGEPPQDADIHSLTADAGALRPLPLHCRDAQPRLHSWLRREYVERTARFTMEMTDAFYAEVAATNGKSRARYFAEKSLVCGPHHELMAELYPGSKEIFLVRDLRDVVCSFSAYFDRIDGVQAALAECKPPTELLLERWHALDGRGFLLRYEDLVLKPDATLTALLRHLELDHSPALVARLLGQVSPETSGMKTHMTSKGAAQSVGRWRREMKPEHVELCQRELGGLLGALGYAV